MNVPGAAARRLGLAALACLGACPLRAASLPENPGATAASVLQIPLGTRAMGMGSAFTAVASDVSALYYNPAGLSRLNIHEISASFLVGLADNSLNHLAYGGPLPFSGVSGSGYASAGASLLYSRNGILEINRTSADGSFLNSESRSAGWDMVATAGYSERVGAIAIDGPAGGIEINNFIGVTGKVIHSNLAEEFSATAYAADAGYLVSVPEIGVSAGFSALNMGSKMKFVDVADPLPSTLRFGASYDWGRLSANAFTLAADGNYLVYDRLWRANAGFEYLWLKNYALRFGWQFNQNKNGVTVGFGLNWQKFVVDYAWGSESGSTLSDTHRLTLTYRFGGLARAAGGKPRRAALEAGPRYERPSVEPAIHDAPAKPKPAPPRPKKAAGAIPGWIY